MLKHAKRLNNELQKPTKNNSGSTPNPSALHKWDYYWVKEINKKNTRQQLQDTGNKVISLFYGPISQKYERVLKQHQ